MMGKLKELPLCAGVLVSLLTVSGALDSLAANQTLKDGSTIVSDDGAFELGFFSLNSSNGRYLGIWSNFISPRTYMWVSNARNPINNTSGVLKLINNGRLLLLSGENTVIWASANTDVFNPVARILDTGNLVVRDDHEYNIWQSNPSYDVCVRSRICGPNGICNNNSPLCSCLRGFEPTLPEAWNMADWSGGCQKKLSLDCANYGFRIVSGMNLPDTRSSWYKANMTLEECRTTCIRNCSCTAYAARDIQSGCFLWFGDLQDMRKNDGGIDLYVKLTTADLAGMEY
ncbi:hypothetical protein E3N88_38242 [Mikania micrantha]|uniref:Bulb-type lectin domain-containing protein n=1 Tax=Mikania micrantha TaxID=192012 RepID=A0A5N6LU77_9ASTR|nr:hypothetical protein E3N88_38242 [Mikania micrantha]